MTDFNVKEYLGSLTSHSIEEVMGTKFFDGKSLEDIWDDITDLEY